MPEQCPPAHRIPKHQENAKLSVVVGSILFRLAAFSAQLAKQHAHIRCHHTATQTSKEEANSNDSNNNVIQTILLLVITIPLIVFQPTGLSALQGKCRLVKTGKAGKCSWKGQNSLTVKVATFG